MSFVNQHDKVHVKRITAQVHDGDDNAVNTTETFDSPDYDRQDLSHSYKTTGKLGMIMPCLSLQVNTGDKVTMSCNMSQQFQPIVAPTLSQIETHQHSFFLPMSVLDYGWHMFNTGGVDGNYTRPLLHISYNPISTIGRDWDFISSSPSMIPDGRTMIVDGFTLWGVSSLLYMLDYPMSRNTYNGVTSCRPIGPFTPARLIAYSRIYNEKYRVPLIETDEWTDQQQFDLNTLYSAVNDVLNKETGEDTYMRIDDFYGRLRSKMPNGWMDFILHYLTDPHMSALRNTTSYARQFYDKDLNEIKLANIADTCLYHSREGVLYINKTWSGMDSIDKVITCFVFNLLIGRCAPWERSRANLMLPWLQKGQYERITLPVLSDKQVNTKSISASVSVSDLVGSLDVPSRKEIVGYECQTSDGAKLRTKLSMNDLREMSALTRFLEKSARVGYKWDEWIKAFFGITDKNYDPHDPVYMGGLKTAANVDKVTSTADTSDASLGDFAGQAFSAASSDKQYVAAPEVGVVIGLYYTKPRMLFIGGFDRNNVKWADKFLYYFREFEHLQEQPVYSGEFGSSFGINTINALNGDDNAVGQTGANMLGYEPRLSEYKQHMSHIGGELVSSLRYWTMARDLQDVEETGSGLTVANNYDYQHVNPTDPSVNRIFQVDSLFADNFVVSFGWNVSVLTEVPINTEPSNNL